MKKKTATIVLIIIVFLLILSFLAFPYIFLHREEEYDYSQLQEYNLNSDKEGIIVACINTINLEGGNEIYCYNSETTNYDIVDFEAYDFQEGNYIDIIEKGEDQFNFVQLNNHRVDIYTISEEEISKILESWKEVLFEDTDLFITEENGKIRIDQFNYLRLQHLKTLSEVNYEFDFLAFLEKFTDESYLIPNPAKFEDVNFFYKENNTFLDVEDLIVFNELIPGPYERLLEYGELEGLIDEEGNFRAYDVMFLLNMVRYSLSEEQELYLLHFDKFEEYMEGYQSQLEYYIEEYDLLQSEDFIDFLINYFPNDGSYARQYIYRDFWLESEYDILVKYIDSICDRDECLRQKLNLLFLLSVEI